MTTISQVPFFFYGFLHTQITEQLRVINFAEVRRPVERIHGTTRKLLDKQSINSR